MKSKALVATLFSIGLVSCVNKMNSAAGDLSTNKIGSAQFNSAGTLLDLKNTHKNRLPSSASSNQSNVIVSSVLESEESCTVPTYDTINGVAQSNAENATYGQCQIKIRFSKAASQGIILFGNYSIEISATDARETVVNVGNEGLDVIYYADKNKDQMTEKKSLHSICLPGTVRDVHGRCGILASANPQSRYLKVNSTICAGWVYNNNAGDICSYIVGYDVSNLLPERNGLRDIFKLTYAMIDANGALGSFATGIEISGKGSISGEPFYRMHYSNDAARKWVILRNGQVIDELIVYAPKNSDAVTESTFSK